MKKLLLSVLFPVLLILLLSCSGAGNGEGEKDSGLIFEEKDGVLYVTGCTEEKEKITVPSENGGKKVVGIADGAFSEKHLIKEVEIGEGIREIGKNAFKLCVSLEKITLPTSLVKIGSNAFAECRELKEIFFPKGVEEIGSLALSGCVSLEKITVEEGCPAYKSDESGALLTKDGTTLIMYPAANGESSYTVSEGVKVVSPYAFARTEYLEEIVFPQSLTEIGFYAFSKSGIKSVEFPDSLAKIGNYAFSESEIEKAVCGKGTESFGVNAFERCVSLKEVVISDSLKEIGINALHACPLEKITVSPDNPFFASDGYGALYNKDMTELIRFPNASDISEYEVPEGVKTIAPLAFASSYGLTKITLPSTLENYGKNAFSYCIELKEIINKSEIKDQNAYDLMFENE